MSYDFYLSSLSPVGWWKMADSVGSSTAADSSGGAFPLTVNGTVTFGQATPSPINSGTGALFDGSTGYLIGTLNSAQAAWFTGSFTVVVWANISNWATAGVEDIFSAGGTSFASNTILQILTNSSGLTIGFYGDDWATGVTPSSGWHMLALTVTRGATTSVRELFVDGVSVGSNTSTGNLSIVSGNFLEFSKQVGSTAHWAGDIAQGAVFASALTSMEISDIYAGGPGIVNSGFLSFC